MAKLLVVFAGDSPADPVAWRIVEDKGDILSRGVCLIPDLPLEAGRSMTLVLPGDRVVVVLASVAARSEKQLRAAAPFAVEDDVGADLDDVHIAIGALDAATGLRPLHIVERDYLRGFIAAVEQGGFSTLDVMADHALIGGDGEGFEQLELSERHLVSNGVWSAAIDRDLDPGVQRSLVVDVSSRWTSSGEEEAHEPVLTPLHVEDPLDYLAARARGRTCSLLQGQFERSRSTGGADLNWMQWRLPIGLAAASAVAIISLAAAEGVASRQETRQLRAETERLFRQAFPDVSRVVDPRRQLRTQLGGKTGVSEFLELSSMLALAVEANEGVDIQALRYDDQQSQLQASVAFSSYDDMAELKQVIESYGASVVEGGSRQSDGGRLGEITVNLP